MNSKIKQKATRIHWALLKNDFEVVAKKFGTWNGQKCVFFAVEKLAIEAAKKIFKDSKNFRYVFETTNKVYTPEHKLTAIYCIEN